MRLNSALRRQTLLVGNLARFFGVSSFEPMFLSLRHSVRRPSVPPSVRPFVSRLLMMTCCVGIERRNGEREREVED